MPQEPEAHLLPIPISPRAGRRPPPLFSSMATGVRGDEKIRVRTSRVALADDDVLLREGLASLLERSGIGGVGQTGAASELLSLARASKPDLVVVDIRMPPAHSTEGLEAARVIR